ncbi:hypothetical protein [Sphingomonas xanthus]|uniref:Uncharacterized protein n=1 Tax=Sphingomonas xanthus TaxID=2594473 RepID=A0A516IQA8_9SPHN|nr:hypothetical protein [Sphingomonas xanthus]QDP19101.1 hypothetical protein FMM02_03460 [Sphingomonas xanthus]
MTSLIALVSFSLLAGAPSAAGSGNGAAPAGTAATRYCMKAEPATGSRVEAVRCWTRAEWAKQGVDVDNDWPREGVRVIG